jgi:hypothetical protein
MQNSPQIPQHRCRQTTRRDATTSPSFATASLCKTNEADPRRDSISALQATQPGRWPRCSRKGFSTMPLLRWIRSRADGKIVAQQVERLLARTTTHVVESTLSRAVGLQRAEARGYVRAKAAGILLQALESASAAAAGSLLPPRLQPVVLHAATERVTAAVLEQLGRKQTAVRAFRRAA